VPPDTPPTQPIPNRPPRYRLYIDESGDHSYTQSEEMGAKYLALLGVWFLQNPDYIAFDEALSALKDRIFGPRPDKPIVFHRTEIVRKSGPFGVLQDPKKRAEFNAGVLELIRSSKFKLVCVLLNKIAHREKYAYPIHPYHYCLGAVLDRYCGWLNINQSVGDVMAESRGKYEDGELKKAYRRVYEGGTIVIKDGRHKKTLTTKEIKFEEKRDNIAGLQLADLLAHPVKQMALVSNGLCPDPGPVFAKDVWAVVQPHLNRRFLVGVEGYGIVWLQK
jgi:Protein of unknown function (DUF3800)